MSCSNDVNCTKMAGLLYAVLGVLCLGYPFMGSLFVEVLIGAAMLVAAFTSLFSMPAAGGFWRGAFHALLALLYGVGGVCMLMFPVWGMFAATAALGTLFIVEGVLMFVYWFAAGNSALALLNALVSFVLGVLVLSNISDGLWFLGVLVGIDLLFRGVFCLFTRRKYEQEV